MRKRQNNREMIEKLCGDTWRELYGFIYYKVQNREEAEDITQETYAKGNIFLKQERCEYFGMQKIFKVHSNEYHSRSMEGKKEAGQQCEFRGRKS